MRSNWDRVIGQSGVKSRLQNAIRNNRLAHGYLFWGTSGVGKDALAIEFARTLLCREKKETACGICPSCKKMDLLQHPNLTLIYPLPGGESTKNDDEHSLENDVVTEVRKQVAEKAADPYFHIEIPKAKFIRIQSIRQVKRQSSMSGAEEGKKIFIVFDADAMNDESSNALLKVLEEPLDGVYFLLVSSRRDALKQTILSRCQLIHCPALSEDEICSVLTEQKGLNPDEARSIARLAEGNYARAVALCGADRSGYGTDAVQFLRSVLGSSALRLMEEQEEYMTGNRRDQAEQLLMMLLVWFRDAVVVREHASDIVITIGHTDDLNRFVHKFGERRLEECMAAVERSLELLRRNVYLPLVMLSLTAHLRRLLHVR